MLAHKERVKRVQRFADSNKLFTIFAIVIVLFLLSHFIIDNGASDEVISETETSQSEQAEEAVSPEQTADEPHWRFYWIDLWVLIGAGGFCSVMIIRQRIKAKEELQ